MHVSLGRSQRAVLIGAVASAVGCTTTVPHQLVRYQPGEPTVTQPVHAAALYEVKIRDQSDPRKLHSIDGTQYLLRPGGVVGFRTDKHGIVYATANDAILPLKVRGDRTVVWFFSEDRSMGLGSGVKQLVTNMNDSAVPQAVIATTAALGIAVAADLAEEHISSNDESFLHHLHHHD